MTISESWWWPFVKARVDGDEVLCVVFSAVGGEGEVPAVGGGIFSGDLDDDWLRRDDRVEGAGGGAVREGERLSPVRDTEEWLRV
jgi:hypothetical protein